MLESLERADKQLSSLNASSVNFRSSDARALFATRANEQQSSTHLEFSNIYADHGITDGYASSANGAPQGAIPVSQRRELINSALSLSGVAATPANTAAVEAIVQHESSWNAQAVNLTDSNASAGHPSKGLMQTIPSTFEQYALPGHNQNISDPLSNLVAGIRYAVDRYGSLERVPGVEALARNDDYRGY